MLTRARSWLTAGAAVGGLLLAASPALAAPAPAAHHAAQVQSQVTDASVNPICLHSFPSYCIHSNGAGNQVTISNNANDWANFHVVRSGTDVNGNTDYQWENANGNCLREGSGNVVKLQNGGCVNGTADNWWAKGGAFVSWTLGVRNFAGSDYMLTHGAVSGWNVWAISSPGNGDDWRWDN